MTSTTSAAAPPSASPESLLVRYRATGDAKALAALFDATAPSLFRIALSLVRDATAAEDALQETYIAALEHLDRYDASRPLVPWLVGILRVMAMRARRDAARVPDPVRVAAVTGAEREGEEPAERGEDAQRVRAAIEQLEEPYRSVALLRWRYGLSPAEIADVRGEPPGTVRSVLSRATARLKETLRGAPAFFLFPTGPRGLEGVREAVLRRAAAIPLPAPAGAVAGATAGAGASRWLLSKAALGAAALVVAGVTTWGVLARGPGDDRGPDAGPGAPPVAAAAPSQEPAVAPDAPAPAPAVVPPPTPVEPDDPRAASPTPTAPDVTAPTPPDLRPQGEPDLPIPVPVEPPPVQFGDDPKPKPPVGPAEKRPDDDLEGVGASLGSRIDRAIDAGVKWLKAAQLPDGSWGLVQGDAAYGGGEADPAAAYTHPAGPTALALYALLKSDVPLDDPAVKRGFAWLRARQRVPRGSYETSALLLAVTATAPVPRRDAAAGAADGDGRPKLPAGDWRDWAQKLVDALLAQRKRAKTLGWRYGLEGGVPPGGAEDLSSTQLAALALLSADRCGIRVESRVWREILAFTLRQQEADGPARPRVVDAPGTTQGTTDRPVDRARGFAYILSEALDPDEGRPTGGMTACGIATLQIARFALTSRGEAVDGDRVRAADVQRAIYDGLAWLDAHWSSFSNPQKKRINVYHVAWLYAAERAFDLLGVQRIGSHLWYREMAEQLVGRQAEKGFWDSDSTHKPQAVLDTSFALLFLHRAGRGPIQVPSLTDPSDRPPTDRRGG